MDIKRIIAGHLLVLTLAFPPAVFAEDFTFDIGVDLLSIHESVSTVVINCQIMPSNGTESMGGGAKSLSVPASGDIKRTIQVKVNLKPGEDPWDAGRYICVLYLVDPNRGPSKIPSLSSGNCHIESNEWSCPKMGTELIATLEGDLSGPSTSSSKFGTIPKVGSKSGIPLELRDQ